jgi:predicted DNA binding CopG/RHH family protein
LRPRLNCAAQSATKRATTASTRDATIEAIGQMEKALTSLTSLLAQTEELQRRIADLQRQSRSGAIAHVKTMMVEHKLSIADIEAKDAKDRASAQRMALKTVV